MCHDSGASVVLNNGHCIYEAIVKVMLFCQHIQEAKNDGLELGFLDVFGDIIWLTAATFSSFCFLLVCSIARPNSTLG